MRLRSRLLGKYEAIPLPAKTALWFTVCNFLLKGISFITVPIFARLLPSTEYGLLAVFLSYEQLILILATWEIQLGAYQKGIFKYKDDVENFTIATQALINILTIACFGIIFLFHDVVSRVTGMSCDILSILFLFLLVSPAYNCYLTRKRKSYEYRQGVSVTLLYSLTNVIFPMVALLLIDRTANIKFGSALIGSILVCMVFFLPHARYWRLRHLRQRTEEYWRFCISFEGPLVLHSLSFLILAQADRVMIKELVGPSQAAFYSVAYAIASVVALFQSSVNASLSPWRYQMLDEKKYSSIKDITNVLLAAFAAIIVLFILIAPELMRTLFPPEYYEAIWCIPPISISVYFMFLYSIFVNIEEYYEKTAYVLYVSIICGMINVVLNYFCIDIFGYIACAYTTVISYVLFSAGHYAFMRKTLRQENVSASVVDGERVFRISCILVICSVLVTILYSFANMRYLLFIGFLIMVFRKRKYLTRALSVMKR